MAIADKNNPFLNGVSGRIGNFVVRQVNGQTIISKRPEKRKTLSKHQSEAQKRFAVAASYANMHMRNPELKAMYEKGITVKKRTAYIVATSDFLTPPSINGITLTKHDTGADSRIQIKAVDDFKVVSVIVTIESHDGKLIERGDAQTTRAPKGCWRYHTMEVNSVDNGNNIIISATDFAGNITTKKYKI